MKFTSLQKFRRYVFLGIMSSAIALTLNFSVLVLPQNSYAQIPYGGLRVFTLPCTCSANFLLYIYDYATQNVLSLVYQPGASLLYSYYNIYATYMLGSYTPGAGQCQIYAGTSCTQVTSNGQLDSFPGTGTTSQ